MIVFIEDGAKLESCKSFKFNAKDFITKFDQDGEQNETVRTHTYMELLDFCSD